MHSVHWGTTPRPHYVGHLHYILVFQTPPPPPPPPPQKEEHPLLLITDVMLCVTGVHTFAQTISV